MRLLASSLRASNDSLLKVIEFISLCSSIRSKILKLMQNSHHRGWRFCLLNHICTSVSADVVTVWLIFFSQKAPWWDLRRRVQLGEMVQLFLMTLVVVIGRRWSTLWRQSKPCGFVSQRGPDGLRPTLATTLPAAAAAVAMVARQLGEVLIKIAKGNCRLVLTRRVSS